MRVYPHSLDWKYVAMYAGGPVRPRLNVTTSSQCGQDLTIADIFAHKRDGVFLELGANDALQNSKTFTLEQSHGWRGLCVEPNPTYTKGYLHRSCQLVQAVVGPRDGVKVDVNLHNGVFGGVVGFDNAEATNQTESHYTVSIETLLKQFDMPRVIDYLSLDIEGAEAWVFETFPWESYTFLVITVERPKPPLKGMLTNNGYVHVCNHASWGDEMWLHKTLPDFEALRKQYGSKSQCREPGPGEPRC